MGMQGQSICLRHVCLTSPCAGYATWVQVLHGCYTGPGPTWVLHGSRSCTFQGGMTCCYRHGEAHPQVNSNIERQQLNHVATGITHHWHRQHESHFWSVSLLPATLPHCSARASASPPSLPCLTPKDFCLCTSCLSHTPMYAMPFTPAQVLIDRNETLLQTLARMLREDGKRSIDLSTNIVAVFFSVSNFSQVGGPLGACLGTTSCVVATPWGLCGDHQLQCYSLGWLTCGRKAKGQVSWRVPAATQLKKSG